MAIQSVTLQSLMDAVADRADIAIDDSQRHTTSKVVSRINRAIRRWHMMAALAGDDTYISVYRATCNPSITVGADGYSPSQYITIPSSDPILRRLKLWLDDTYSIDMMPWDRMADAQIGESWAWWTNSGTGAPVFYRPISEVSGGGSNRIQIFPKASQAWKIDVHYIPGHSDITDVNATHDFVLGGDEYVINDATLQTLMADGLASEGNAQAIAAFNEQIKKDMVFQLAARNARSKMDTKEHKRLLVEIARGYRPVP